MTSRLAFSYNRDVYALPGRIDDIRSQGCNWLIRSKIAEPIISTDGLIESLGLTPLEACTADNPEYNIRHAYTFTTKPSHQKKTSLWSVP